MNIYLLQIINGIGIGMLYFLLAVGLSIVFGLLRFVNFRLFHSLGLPYPPPLERHLDEAGDRVAREAQVVFHADLGGVFNLFIRASHDGGQPGGGHRAGDANLALTSHLGGG